MVSPKNDNKRFPLFYWVLRYCHTPCPVLVLTITYVLVVRVMVLLTVSSVPIVRIMVLLTIKSVRIVRVMVSPKNDNKRFHLFYWVVRYCRTQCPCLVLAIKSDMLS